MIAAGKEELKKWFAEGVKRGQKYMIIVYDRMAFPDESDSAYYAESEEEAREMVYEFDRDELSKVMEVYDLTKPRGPQLRKKRAWCLPEIDDDDIYVDE